MRTVTSTIRQPSKNNTVKQANNAATDGKKPGADAAAGSERVPPPMVVPAMRTIVESTLASQNFSVWR
eukprot:7134011-Pyramimonas_sp.AAC.1